MTFTFIPNITGVSPIPEKGILSQTVYENEQMKVIWFGFAVGEELSEHTASIPAVIHILQGEARLIMGEDEMEGQAGTWVQIPAKLPHSVHASTPVAILLLMFKNAA